MIVNVTLLKLSDLLYLQLLVNISVIRSTDSLVNTGTYRLCVLGAILK